MSQIWGSLQSPSKECKSCQTVSNRNFEFGIIHRSDISEDEPLHPQCAFLPKHLDCCSDCSGRESIHWTELLVHCRSCTIGDKLGVPTMVFSHYVRGTLIKEFTDHCMDMSKPNYPPLTFIDEKGHEQWILNHYHFTSN